MERCIVHGEALINCPTCTEEIIARETLKLRDELKEVTRALTLRYELERDAKLTLRIRNAELESRLAAAKGEGAQE
jgi:hypothetical protein